MTFARSDICAKRHLHERHLCQVGLKEKELALRANGSIGNQSWLNLHLESAHPAYYLSPSPSLVPVSQPEASLACHGGSWQAGLAPDRLVVSEGSLHTNVIHANVTQPLFCCNVSKENCFIALTSGVSSRLTCWTLCSPTTRSNTPRPKMQIT